MLIRFGLGGQMSGSVGGVTAGHNKGGQYLRNRSIPTNPNSTRQQAARTALGTAAQRWRTLTQAQRDAWEGYANQTPLTNRLGESITISGSSMYTRTNSFLLGLGETPIDDAPSSPGQASIGSVDSVVASILEDNATFTLDANDALDHVILQVGPTVSAGVNSFNGPYTFMSYDVASVGEFIGQFAATRYGVMTEGDRRPYRIRGIDSDGRLSNVAQGFFDVVA